MSWLGAVGHLLSTAKIHGIGVVNPRQARALLAAVREQQPSGGRLVAFFGTQTFGTSPGGKLFRGIRGGELPTMTCRRAWIAARKTALSPEQQRSPFAKRVYDLRHAGLSLWSILAWRRPR